MNSTINSDTLQTFLKSLSSDPGAHTAFHEFSDRDWERFIGWADFHRLLPVLASTLTDPAIPGHVSETFKAAAANAIAHNLALKGLSKTVLTAFRECDIECLPFKGPDLAEYLYGSASARACYDIDLVILPDDYLQASDALTSLGLRRDAPETNLKGWQEYRYEECYTDPRKNLFLELHWRFMPAFIPFNLTSPSVLAMTDSNTYSAGSSYLPNHTLFILLAAHGYRHCWRQLCWLTDIIRLIDLGVDWAALVELATVNKVKRIVRLALALAATIPGVEVPQLNLAPLSVGAERYVDSIVESWRVPGEDGGLTDYRYIRTFLDTFYQRQVCLKRLTFQPTLADFDYINLPPVLQWLYPGVRFARLITRKRKGH